MPKIVKTFKSDTSTKDPLKAFTNMVKAVEAALGVAAIRLTDIKYYIPTESIGFPGYCIRLELVESYGTYTYTNIGIYTTQSSGVINESDPYTIKTGMDTFETSSDWMLSDYNPATCVLFTDRQKDTISFSVVLSASEDCSDVPKQTVCGASLKAFLAKDVNDGILCGVGDNHISAIRTKDSKASPDSGNVTSVHELDTFPSCLHLTKMVNYLSPGYPEMKSAYVTVVRPKDGYANESYYADGALWGFAGYYPEVGITTDSHAIVPAISPWVKY